MEIKELKEVMLEQFKKIDDRFNKVDGQFDSLQRELNDFKTEMYAFRKEMYRFQIKTDSQFESLFYAVSSLGSLHQNHEDRIIAIERAA